MSSAFRNNTNSAGSTASSPGTSKGNAPENDVNQSDVIVTNVPVCDPSTSNGESSTSVSWTAAPPKKPHMEVRLLLSA